jgi:hypothetical protein
MNDSSVFSADPLDRTYAQQANGDDDNESVISVLTEDDGPSSSAPPVKKSQPQRVDLSDETAFPSLGGSSNASKTGSLWGSMTKTKPIAPIAARSAFGADVITETVKLEAAQQEPRKALGAKNAISDVVKQVQSRTSTTIQTSTTQRSGTTVFLIKGKAENVASARRGLLKELGKKVRHASMHLLLITGCTQSSDPQHRSSIHYRSQRPHAQSHH